MREQLLWNVQLKISSLFAQIENSLATPGMEYDSEQLASADSAPLSLPSPAPTPVIQCVFWNKQISQVHSLYFLMHTVHITTRYKCKKLNDMYIATVNLNNFCDFNSYNTFKPD